MRLQGKITRWKDDQGFGFITPADGGQQVFVHIKSFSNRQRRPVENEMVSYEAGSDARGRARAENVEWVGERAGSKQSWHRTVTLLLAIAFLLFLWGMAFSGRLPRPILFWYLIASAVAFIAYALDKSAARDDRQRTRETTLHLFSLIGGWPGALAAQGLLRHKSRKLSFQVEFWITVVLNCALLGWLLSSDGEQTLRPLLDIANRMVGSGFNGLLRF